MTGPGESTADRWLAPRDGGRGREVRTRWSQVRWFSWTYGSWLRRGQRWFTPLTWHVWSMRNLLLGVWAYRDDDEDWNIEVGLGPLLHLHLTITDWPRPSGDLGSNEADGRAFGADDAGTAEEWRERSA